MTPVEYLKALWKEELGEELDYVHLTKETYEKVLEMLAAPPDMAAVVAERDRFRDTLQDVRGHYERVCAERDAAFKMSRCECGADEACANLAKLHSERDALRGEVADLKTKLEETLVSAISQASALRQDAARVDWLARQDLQDLSMGIVIDAPHDGDYYVSGDNDMSGYGPTFRAAIDAAMKETK